MSGNFKKKDLRVQRTYKALCDSLFKLLKKNNISKITVNDICEEALVSRASFYIHFNDKYDLLLYSCLKIKEKILLQSSVCTIDNILSTIQYSVKDNYKILNNLLNDSSSESYKIIIDIIADFFITHYKTNKITLAQFCSAGIIHLTLNINCVDYEEIYYNISYLLKD